MLDGHYSLNQVALRVVTRHCNAFDQWGRFFFKPTPTREVDESIDEWKIRISEMVYDMAFDHLDMVLK